MYISDLLRYTLLNFKKKNETTPVEEQTVANCPACNSYVCHAYYMVDKTTNKKSRWWSCSCGVIFNAKNPDGKFDQVYYDKHSRATQKVRAEWEYPILTYLPIIEECLYGRRVLLLGADNHFQHELFAERGWVPTTIDKNTRYSDSQDFIASDFETHQFPEATKYNLIWIYGTLENLQDPIASLECCKKLLSEDGVIFIASADTDFINTRSSVLFINWKGDYNNVMWNKRTISKQMESLGFNTILCRSNHENRYAYKDDFHGIWQKKFY